MHRLARRPARFFGLSVEELDAGLVRHGLTRPEFDPIQSPLITKRRTAPDFYAMHVALTVVEAAIAHERKGAKRDGVVHFLGAACQAIEQVLLAEYDKRHA